ncbi:MAG TPA: Ig-like domain-containing protein [Azospirillaceae bacterium]|nr:Ig-like domain-containing protein [Azospirillaceae bacterium]
MKAFRNCLLLATALTAVGGPAMALDVHLVARPFDKVMPDGVTVRMWGYALDPDGPGEQEPGPATAPGPVITVPPGEATLRIHLTNELPVPTSLVIPGQIAAPNPTWIDGSGGVSATGSRPDGDYVSRVRSMMPETAPGATRVYTWDAPRAGTFLYRSSTHPQVQVQMGLYGAVRQDEAEGVAYAGVAYDNQAVLLFSEVDPALHGAVADGSYGTEAYPSTIDYEPKYFLVNGEPFPQARPLLDHPIQLGERVLVRLLNGGLQTRVAIAPGLRFGVVAEDGFRYPHPRDQHSVLLSAGKARDAAFTATEAGVFTVMDRRLNLTNDRLPEGGQMVQLQIPGSGAPIAANDLYTATRDTALDVAAPGLLDNDIDPDGGALQAALVTQAGHGTVVVNPDGSFSYEPAAGYTGPDSFTYLASDGTSDSNVATVSISVRTASPDPVANPDSYDAVEDTPLTVAAPGVLGNDNAGEGGALSAAIATYPAKGNVALSANGGFTYTPHPNFSGGDSFSYKASDATTTTPAATVTITVAAANDPPNSANDSFQLSNGSTSVAAPGVLVNDTDLDGDSLTAVLQSGPAHAQTFALNPDGSFTFVAIDGFAGSDSFTYSATDGTAAGNTATVTIVKNNSPIANPDSVATRRRTPVTINILGNDTDADGTLMPSTVTITAPPTKGTASANLNGTVTYTPSGGSSGTDRFSYTVKDDLGALSNVAAVTVVVQK